MLRNKMQFHNFLKMNLHLEIKCTWGIYVVQHIPFILFNLHNEIGCCIHYIPHPPPFQASK